MPEHPVEDLDHLVYLILCVVCHIDAVTECLFTGMIKNQELDGRILFYIDEDLVDLLHHQDGKPV